MPEVALRRRKVRGEASLRSRVLNPEGHPSIAPLAAHALQLAGERMGAWGWEAVDYRGKIGHLDAELGEGLLRCHYQTIVLARLNTTDRGERCNRRQANPDRWYSSPAPSSISTFESKTT